MLSLYFIAYSRTTSLSLICDHVVMDTGYARLEFRYLKLPAISSSTYFLSIGGAERGLLSRTAAGNRTHSCTLGDTLSVSFFWLFQTPDISNLYFSFPFSR